ncbi:hypothetical protein [Vagococcus fluvialis]|uniref:hypothetical protein n=1 Tax=Vagococcus fluvialis TaxID=2738 RepID=UPI003B21D8F8
MDGINQVIDFLNKLNGVLLLIGGVTLNQCYQKFKRWRKKDVISLDEKVTMIEETVELLKDSNLALSHDKLYTYCTTYIERGYVTVGELDNLEYLFSSYKGLGGNGTGEHLYNEVKKLKIKGGD